MEPTSEATPLAGRSLRAAAHLTAGMGIASAVLLLISFAILGSAPPSTATDEALIAYYGGPDRRWVILAGLYLMPFAAIAFIWFIVALRMWVARHGRPEHALFSNVQLVSGIALIVLFLVAASAYSVDAALAELTDVPVAPASARQFPQFGSVIVLVLAMRMAAMFVITTSSIGRHSRILPRWFVWLGFVVGTFLLLAAVLNTIFVVVFPAWMLVLGGLLLVRARRITGVGPPAQQP
jgi:hypothetical protein